MNDINGSINTNPISLPSNDLDIKCTTCKHDGNSTESLEDHNQEAKISSVLFEEPKDTVSISEEATNINAIPFQPPMTNTTNTSSENSTNPLL